MKFKNKGWDLLAASDVTARKNYATYLLYGFLIDKCTEAGALEYDLGGICPNKAKGVYNFKKGTGAQTIQYLGEWECAKYSWLAKLSNKLIKWKFKY